MFYALAAGLRAVLERCWPGSMLGAADFVRCRSGLGLDFWVFYTSSSNYAVLFSPRLAVLAVPSVPFCRSHLSV